MSGVLLAWSSGKDSAFSLHVLRSQGVEVGGLLTTMNAAADRVAMHAVRHELLDAQAAAVGLPLQVVDLPWPCSNEDYERAMAAALAEAREKGIEAVAFGDLFLADVRRYREERMEGMGLELLFPLWGRDTTSLAQEMIDSGQKAVLTCVDPRLVPSDLVGRPFDRKLLKDLPEGADPCGENGEFHTFAWDGPAFGHALDVEVGETVERDGFVYADIVPRPSPRADVVPSGERGRASV